MFLNRKLIRFFPELSRGLDFFMVLQNILKLTDTLAETLITADLEDLQDVGRIYDLFLKIGEAADSVDAADIVKTCEEASGFVKQVMMDESYDRGKAYTQMNDLISKIQYLSRSGYSSSGPGPEIQNPADEILSAEKTAAKNFTLPEIVDADIFNEFLSEQNSVLDTMEMLLLTLEKAQDAETVNTLKRVFHTLKGEAAVFGLNDVVDICHLSEDVTEGSDGNLPIDKLLTVKDWLKEVFDALKADAEMPEPAEEMIGMLKDEREKASDRKVPVDQKQAAQSPEKPAEEAPVDQKQAAQPPEKPAEDVPAALQATETRISGDVDLISDFVSEAQEHIDNIDSKLLVLESNPEDPDILNAVFRVFHTIKGAAGFLVLDDIARLAHTTENLLDLARKRELVLTGHRIDVVFESVDQMNLLVDNIRETISSGASTYRCDPKLNGLIAKIKNIISGQDSAPVPDAEKPQQPAPVQSPAADPDVPVSAGDASSLLQSGTSVEVTKQSKVKIKESIKIDSENLDRLVDAIGELVIIESMIRQDSYIKNTQSSKLLKNITQMDKITRELQSLSMSLRMIPVRATFQKMARVVRDLAKKSGKRVEFNTYGEDTMLDKSVVDRIGDPLIHLVRNSVDHGIELSPEDRVKANKDETGRVELNAFHKGGNIHIEIKDDGRGLDKTAILKKATEKGLVKEGQSLNDQDIFNLILLPGFSTAKKVTDVSGRGVGMDVVKRNIEDLRGNIEISSQPGQGSLFSLRLPLTLAIIDGMLVRIGDERYIIPTLSIVQSIRPTPEDVTTVINRGEMIRIRDDLIPLFRLAKLFNIANAVTDLSDGIVIVVEDSGKMTGLLVDELLGQQSTVIKNLGASMKGLTGISGGSILSDGQVGLILDVAGLVKLATRSADRDISNIKKNSHGEA